MKHSTVSWIVGIAGLLFVLALAGLKRHGQPAERLEILHARPTAVEPKRAASPAASIAANPSATNRAVTATRIQGTLLPSQDQLWEQLVSEPEFARFAEWVKKYRAASAVEKAALTAEGIQLARERRESLRRLIQLEPARALALAVPLGVRRALPESVTRLLEDHLSGRGSLDVLAALAEPGQEKVVTPTFRTAKIEGRDYEAFVYGRRLGEPTRPEVALNGVVLDNLFAVNENPLRLLDPEEVSQLKPLGSEPLCAISGNPSTINQSQIVGEVGGQPVFLCGLAHAEKLNEKLIQAEVAGDTGGGGGEVQASTRTEGIKKLLLIRVDFSDLAGAPFADSTGISLISGLNSFYTESSFGRTGFAPAGGGSDVTPTLRLPQTAAYYGQNDFYVQLRTDARNAAVTAGYVLGNYDYDLICFGAVPGWGWAGLGYVGAAGVWLRNYFTPGVAGHELGHNYGLNHANFWDTDGQSIIGAGTSVEYGDSYDTMGAANAGANHFNARYKSYLNWLTSSDTLTVSTSGVYRIYPQDDTNSTGLRGLKIVRSSTTNYWVEFRQKFTSNRWLMSGAGIRWAGNGNERSHLLDTTPGSPDGKSDAALVVGRSFSDKPAGIHITTLRKGGTTPESLDIAVNLGTFPGNNDPTVSVSASASAIASGAPVTLSATASDLDGDTLAYYWDFGDGTFGTNGPAAGKSWASSGEYVVRCVVSDMKGGEASASVIVTVANPGTYRIAGRVIANGSPVEGARVSVSSVKMAYTDSDGTYTLVGLPAGSYTVSANLDGYTFAPLGFANPVTVGPNASGIDFLSGNSGGGGNVTLTSPTSGSSFIAPEDVFLAASASPAAGQSVTKVEFFQGTTKLGEDVTLPYSFTWNGAPAGTYALTARSTESSGIMVTSAPVTITVTPTAPTITGQPQSQTVTAGGNVTFGVTATGSGPLWYQWRRNGIDLSGANSSTLSLVGIQPQQAGGYSVVVTNSGGAVTSTVATLTVNCTFSLSASSVSFGFGGGSGSVNVLAQNGCLWSVTSVPAWITITSGNGGSGNGTVNYTVANNSGTGSRSATLIIAGHNYAVTQGAPDLTWPTVTITSPAANATVTNTVITVSGSADDDTGLASVEWRVGSGAFAPATGTTAWSAQVTLAPGTNVVGVRSVDLSGNLSVTNTRSFFCAVPGTLNLAIKGKGHVKGGTNGQQLEIGRPYQLTAQPDVGCVFSNWSGDLAGNTPSLTFVMQSNVAVTANFVTNPFTPVQGVFTGLFYETNEVRLGCSGFFKFKPTDKGTYTASILILGKKSSASGRLNLDGTATNVIPRPGTNALTVTWAVDLGGSDQIRGTIGDGSWTAQLLGDRAVYSAIRPAPSAGLYTLAIPGTPGATLVPEGDSYGTARVEANGFVNLKGYLADHSSIAIRVSLSESGHWPLYASLYGGKGTLLGWVTLADQTTNDFDGLMSWIKPALPTSKYYAGGFTNEPSLAGARYTPSTGVTNRILSLTNGLVLLDGGDLSQSFTNAVVLGPGNKLTNASPNSLALTFNPASGLFRGSFLPPGNTRPVAFKGAVRQKANEGSGYFLGTNQSGRVLINAAP